MASVGDLGLHECFHRRLIPLEGFIRGHLRTPCRYLHSKAWFLPAIHLCVKVRTKNHSLNRHVKLQALTVEAVVVGYISISFRQVSQQEPVSVLRSAILTGPQPRHDEENAIGFPLRTQLER